MTTLDTFLDKGSLPFIGRAAELERMVAFWRQALHGDGMRILLVEGEAGVGKSRLVQEAVARIDAERGTVVHVKLYAEMSSAIAPLLRDALARTELMRDETSATIASVADAIRRLARLRPAVLIFEDIHLLSGAPLRELIDLFEAIEDESIAVIVTTRTQEHTARTVIERWPLERLTIAPFTSSDLADAWRSVLNDNPSESIIATLADATAGSPLALRSALRGALRAKAIVQAVDGMWIAQPSFAAVAARSASSLVEGMLVAVSDDDRIAASRLATLGEIFSREAALVIEDADTIDRLIAEGVLHVLAQSAPALPGLAQSASLALAFSHSLVHRHFIEARSAPVSQLSRVIADGLPLYSMHPFVVVAETLRQSNVAIEGISAHDLRAAINASSSLALALDKTVDWALAIVAQNAAEQLLALEAQSLDDTERIAREVSLTAVTLALMRRQMTSPEYGTVLDRFVAMTGDELAPSLSWYRLARSIAVARRRYLIEGYEAGRSVYEFVRRIVADEPALRTHRQYALVLQTFAQFADEHDDTSMRREIEHEYRDIIDNPSIDEDHRVLLQTQVLPYLLTLFESADELHARERMYIELQQLEKHPSPMARLLVHAMLPSAPAFLARTGRVDELIAFIADRRDMVKAQGMLVVHYYFDLYQLWCDTLLGLDSDRVLTRLRELARRHDSGAPDDADPFAADARRVYDAALMRGDNALAQTIRNEHAIDDDRIADTDISATSAIASDDSQKVIDQLEQPLLRIENLITVRLLLEKIATVTIDDSQTNRVRAVVERMLAWLEERRLDAIARSIIELQHNLSPKDVTAWKKRFAVITESRATRNVDADTRLSIAMFGRIEIRKPNETESVQPRGARQKSFLGAMVASEMLSKPLERSEFLEAAGIEDGDDPKLARDAVNSAIYRLRDVVGHESVLNDGETPRLNMNVVRVDLIDASTLLRNAETSLKRGSLALAARDTFAALELTRGEVPFPSLYDQIFETLREDFENRLRRTIIAVARRLLAESDASGAEPLLARAFSITSDDEEIADLYSEALEKLGQRVETERVRRASARAEEM